MTAQSRLNLTVFAMLSCVSKRTYTLISLVCKSNQACCVVVALVAVALILVENNIELKVLKFFSLIISEYL